jgi:Trk K+ transport system NAD-binding subunit
VKTIIVGAGKVGYHLAKTLSLYHEITIIDKDFEAISTIQVVSFVLWQ